MGEVHMRGIDLKIEGLPPKKDGASSMWGKRAETPRLLRLRQAVAEAMQDQPLRSEIEIELTVHVGPRNDRQTGDLDNFITGICDGLMAASARMPWAKNETWAAPENRSVRPDVSIGIVDDSQVARIVARKVVADAEAPWYELRLRGV